MEEPRLVELGLRSRVAAPLLVGARAIGLISVGRSEPDAFEAHEIELMSLLGRLAASAVQNMRAYESERRTVEELRKLSALRADFVSLVSHELRSPMAAVIGASRTLELRWRELQPEQREAFLTLISDETSRLAALIGDVLDTSRIDAGTFTYRFTDVDLVSLVTDSVATAVVGQDEVPIVSHVQVQVPEIRGDPEAPRRGAREPDRERRQAPPVRQGGRGADRSGQPERCTSPSPTAGRESTRPTRPRLREVRPRDRRGPEARHRSRLFIARSIAEAHGGRLTVLLAPGRGATFTMTLPLEAA